MKYKGLYYPEGIGSDLADRLTNAADAINGRLTQWASGKADDNDDQISEDGWLHKDVAKSTQDLFKRFYTKHISRQWLKDLGFEGWECGLGQILDIRDTRIAHLLPYLLTAHMYNFRATKHITGFINNSCPATWGATWSNDYFFGVLRDDTIDQNDAGEDKPSPIYGIGKYLMEDIYIKNARYYRLQAALVQSFFFPETVRWETSGCYCTKYVVPKTDLNSFKKRIKNYTLINCDDGIGYPRQYYAGSGSGASREFRCDIYERLFAAWYQTITEAYHSKRKITLLGCEPSAKDCYCLLQCHLQQVPMDSILESDDEKISRFLTYQPIEKNSLSHECVVEGDMIVNPPVTTK